MKNNQILTTEKVYTIIVGLLKNPMERKKLILKCLEELAVPKEILQDRSPEGQANIIKSKFGKAINELVKSGIIIQEDNNLKLKDDLTIEDIKRETVIENLIFEILKIEKKKKKELLTEIEESVSLETSKHVIRTIAGQILKELIKNKVIIRNDGYYILPNETEKSLEERNKQAFNMLSDEELVNQTVRMLAQWYEFNKYEVVEKLNIDGPQDGGIDGIIKMKDGMGYNEKVIIQVKNIHKESRSVPVKEIREFYGVYAADNEATKGIFVSNKKFHSESEKFVKKLSKYFILIDGNKWVQLANDCGYDISEKLISN